MIPWDHDINNSNVLLLLLSVKISLYHNENKTSWYLFYQQYYFEQFKQRCYDKELKLN